MQATAIWDYITSLISVSSVTDYTRWNVEHLSIYIVLTREEQESNCVQGIIAVYQADYENYHRNLLQTTADLQARQQLQESKARNQT